MHPEEISIREGEQFAGGILTMILTAALVIFFLFSYFFEIKHFGKRQSQEDSSLRKKFY